MEHIPLGVHEVEGRIGQLVQLNVWTIRVHSDLTIMWKRKPWHCIEILPALQSADVFPQRQFTVTDHDSVHHGVVRRPYRVQGRVRTAP